MKDGGTFRLVMVTANSEDEATRIARALVQERLAACVNLVPSIRSIYRWQEKVEEDSETLLLIKTSANSLEALGTKIQELHSYDVPEVIALKLDRGSASYLDWLGRNLS